MRVIAASGVSVTSISVAGAAAAPRPPRLRESPALTASAETAVVCDTTAYLPTELVAERGIETISLYVSVDGEQEREVEITDYADFYERLRASESGRDHLAALDRRLPRRLRAAARRRQGDRLDPHLRRHLRHLRGRRPGPPAADRRGHAAASGSTSSTRETAAGGMGLCVLGAAAAAAAGAAARRRSSRGPSGRARTLKMWFAVDTLEYLRRGGRIGGARAWIGGALKIKPILTLEEEITPVERVRTRARSLERLRDYARQRHEAGADAWVVQHIQDDETADALVDDCREIFGCEPVFISEIGAGARRPRRSRPARRRQRADRAGHAELKLRASGSGGRSITRMPTAKPTAAAPMISCCLCSRTWRRQSVSSLTRPRRASTERAELLALDVDVAADLVRRRLATGRCRPLGGPLAGLGGIVRAHLALASRSASLWSASPLRSPAAAPAASRPGPRGRRASRRAAAISRKTAASMKKPGQVLPSKTSSFEQPGDALHDQDQGEEGEDAGGDADDRAAQRAC